MQMKRKEATEYLRGKLPDYVQMICAPDPAGAKNHYVCPICGSGSGSHKTSGFTIYPKTNTWACFACDKKESEKINGGGIFELIGQVEGLNDFTAEVDRAADMFGVEIVLDDEYTPEALKARTAAGSDKPLGWDAAINEHSAADGRGKGGKMDVSADKQTNTAQTAKTAEKGKYKAYIESCAKNASNTDYWQKRGITAGTVNALMLGYDPTKRAVVIPYSKDCDYYIMRNIDEKRYYKPSIDEAGREPVYNAGALYTARKNDNACFVCESQIDAITIIQEGFAAVALGGAGTGKLIELLKSKPSRKTLVLAFDNDEKGREYEREVSAALKNIEQDFITGMFFNAEYPGDRPRKDINDLAQINREWLRYDLRLNKRRTDPPEKPRAVQAAAYYRSGNYNNDKEFTKRYSGRKTGYANIDKYLTLRPGMAILGGTPSAGKTTFAYTLADNLTAAGETVFFYSFEQTARELVNKGVSRRLYAVDPATQITNKDIAEGVTSDRVKEAEQAYFDGNTSLYIFEGGLKTTVQEIEDGVKAFISAEKRRPIVIVDYLQYIEPIEAKADVRAGVDDNVKRLKALQKEYDLLLIVISSFNRTNYNETVSYQSFKESGNIEHTCDYVWALQLSIMEGNEFYRVDGDGKETLKSEKEKTIRKAESVKDKSGRKYRNIDFISLKSRGQQKDYTAKFRYWVEWDTFEPLPDGWEDAENSPFEDGGPAESAPGVLGYKSGRLV